jgi:Fur family transcriptional regulator, ferric uptake regulator
MAPLSSDLPGEAGARGHTHGEHHHHSIRLGQAVNGPGVQDGDQGFHLGGHPDAEEIVALLRARGGRVTPTRRATINVLLAGGEHRHLSAEDVATEVRRLLPDVAESTIYRTLTALEELGVVTHVHLGHGPGTFHLAEAAHRHLVCQRCDSVIEVPAFEFIALARRLEEVYGFAMSSEHFAIVGQCRNCRAEVAAGTL